MTDLNDLARRCEEGSGGDRAIYVFDLNEGRHWGDCPMCEQERRLDHCVGWYCGPTHDEIGSQSTEYAGPDNTVGGMCVCKECHDQFYDVSPRALTHKDLSHDE